MKFAVLCAGLIALVLAGCSEFSSAGSSGDQVIAQAKTGGDIAFDVVKVDDAVVKTVLAHSPAPFHRRFKKYQPPSEQKVEVGDVLAIVIWEASAQGLFGYSLQDASSNRLRPSLGLLGRSLAGPLTVTEGARPGTNIPLQLVGVDGAITVPFVGRVHVAGRTPAEVQETIDRLLAGKAIQPQALVIVVLSPANSVSVAGEVVGGKRLMLNPGGERLLQVIAAAGGAQAPVHDTFVQLSRGGLTATVPLATLVSEPSEDIFARPGDVLTLVRRPQTFSVFGAAGKNAAITFDQDRLSLSEALAKSGGILDDRADPQAVFLFRYEPVSVVRALGEPVATRAPPNLSPIAYRLDLRDPKAYLLAQQFPVHDKDIIFVANAKIEPLYRFFAVLANITGPVQTGIVVCQASKC